MSGVSPTVQTAQQLLDRIGAEKYTTPDADIMADIVASMASIGGGGYVPGTDRFTITCSINFTAADQGNPLTWGQSGDFVTKIGDAIDLISNDITFVEDGCYVVSVHLPNGTPGFASKLALKLLNQNADGGDMSQPIVAEGGYHVGYTWCHAAGDVVTAELNVFDLVDPMNITVVCQVVRLSELAPGDESLFGVSL